MGRQGSGKGASGRRIFLCFWLSVLFAALGVAGLWLWFGSGIAKGKKVHGTAGFTLGEVLGLAGGFYACPLAVVLYLTTSGLFLTKPCTSHCLKVSLLSLNLLIFIGLAAFGAFLAKDVLRCALIFCAADSVVTMNGYYGSLGLALLLPTSVLSLSSLVTLVRTLSNPMRKEAEDEEQDCWASEDDEMSSEGSNSTSSASQSDANLKHGGRRARSWRRLARRRERCRKFAGLMLAVVVLPLLLLLTAMLPNSFQKFEPHALARNMADSVPTAEFPDAWMVTWKVKLSDEVILKFFPDTLIFYGFLEGLALVAVASSLCPKLQRQWGRDLVWGYTVGEGLTLGAFAAMLVLWLTYWLHDHNFHSGTHPGLNTLTERVARTFGLTASLFLALALLPASKKSLWLSALGISWERGLWVHRALGFASIVCMAMHVLTFWIRYAQLGTLAHDACIVPPFYQKGLSSAAKYDNFTISVAMLVGFPSLLFFGVFAPFVRHMRWELFKYTHYMFLVLIPMVLMHGQNAWYFMIGGVAFWLVDIGIRQSSASSFVRILSAKAHHVEGGVTELRLSAASVEFGQFAWINVPAVSTLEWHPFSIASAPQDGPVRLCIKSMGTGTWTQRLLELVEERGRDIAVQFDGPYGLPPAFLSHDALLLLAGGIGITGVLSSFRALALAAESATSPGASGLGRLKFVQLVWSVRSRALLDLAAASLRECVDAAAAREPETGVQFSVKAFVTGDEGDLGELFDGVAVSRGRPSWDGIYGKLCDASGKDPSILVQACGPVSFVESSETATSKYNSKRRQIVFESKAFRF